MAPWPYKTLITLISNSKFETRGLCLSFFIECALCWLAGWCMAGLGVMLLHHGSATVAISLAGMSPASSSCSLGWYSSSSAAACLNIVVFSSPVQFLD
jgi:hypothetical protein